MNHKKPACAGFLSYLAIGIRYRSPRFKAEIFAFLTRISDANGKFTLYFAR